MSTPLIISCAYKDFAETHAHFLLCGEMVALW